MARRYRKSRWMRGSRTHGWGVSGQHRGKGSRGGYGMAGGHKHKWTRIVKYAPNHFGKRGFKPPLSVEDVCINVGELEELALKLGICENGTINLESVGYTKLLGAGSLSKPFNIIVRRASRNAVEKVKSIGGSITILSGVE